MNREDIIRMAREAGAKDYGTGDEGVTALMLRDDAIERFAALVEAAEREACLNCYSPDDTATDWADKIRARGNT